MDAGPSERSCSLQAELAAKSSRVAELEARVLLLEAENARLREAMAMSKAETAGRAGKEYPRSCRLEEDLGGDEREAAEKLGAGSLSDGEEGIAVVDANKGRSPEEGVVAVPTTQRLAEARVLTGESEEDEDNVRDVEGGGSGSDKGNGCCDGSAGLEDDDASVTVRGSNKRVVVARVVTSDSEDDDVSGAELGSGEGDEDADREGGVKASRKRALRGVSDSENEDGDNGDCAAGSRRASRVAAMRIESEDEDDTVPISQVLKKMRKERVSDDDDDDDDDDDESGEAKGCSAPATRRSARLLKKQSKGGRPARQGLEFVEPEEQEGSEDDMEEEDDMDEFINDDDSSENASDCDEESRAEQKVMSGASAPNEESSEELEESDTEINYEDVMACIRRKRKAKDWKFEGEMLAAFDEHPELCLKAVCALYRKQTKEEQSVKAAFVHNKQGFTPIDAARGSRIAEFVLDGDVDGPLKKTVNDLEEYDRRALEFCREVASRYSKQLFAIYQNKEDPYFLP